MGAIQSLPELRRRLGAVRPRLDAIVAADATPAFVSIRDQLAFLDAACASGSPPSPADKDALDFGPMASRHLHETDPVLAEEIYAIATWVTYWR